MIQNRKLKIVYIIDSLGAGGAERLLHDLTKHINKNRFDVSVISIFNKNDLANKFRDYKINLIYLKYNFFYNPLIIFRIEKILKSIKPDIVHTNLLYSDLYGRLAALLAKAPVIMSTCHNNEPWRTSRKINKYYLFRKLDNYLSTKTTKIIAVSNEVNKCLIKQGINYLKILTIYNGIETKFFEKALPSNLYNKKNPNEIILGSVGRLDRQKGYDYLIRSISIVIKKISAVKLFIVGDGPERQNLQKLVKGLKLRQHIIFLGKRNDVAKILKMIDIFVFTPIYEGFGIALLEAMAAGKPIVVSKTGGIIEVIKENKNGLLVKPKDSNEIAGKLLYLIQHKSFWNIMQKNNQNDVKKFDIHNTVNRYEKLYLE